MTSALAARLASLDIQLMAEAAAYSLFVRGACLALVHRAAEEFDSIGASAIMTENGPAYLVWRDGAPRLAAKGGELPATPEQVETIRRFSADLKAALEVTE
ncbi:MAG: hypothetical protein LAP87_05090 [Acidobacteriia bacterium]|nr:hypothetical protein [Terriglobia bacterium]